MRSKIYIFFLLAPMIIGFSPIDGLRHFKSDYSFILIVKSDYSTGLDPLYEITLGELIRTKDNAAIYSPLVKDTLLLSNHSFSRDLKQATFQTNIFIDGKVEKYLEYGENQYIPLLNVTSWKTDKYIPLHRKWDKTDWILYSFLFGLGIFLILYNNFKPAKKKMKS